MYFPTAGIEVSPWIPPLVAFVISFFTSMGGVSGAFLLLPFQMSILGYTTPSVSATNQLFNVVAIPSGVYRYFREGRLVWPLTVIVTAGTLPGVFLGALVRVTWLPDPGYFKLFAACVLLYIGLRMVRELLSRDAAKNEQAESERRFQEKLRNRWAGAEGSKQAESDNGPVKVNHFNLWRLKYTFYGESFEVPFWGVFSLSLVVGLVGGIYGVGGGAIIAPFFVTFFGLPVYTVAGAALMGTFVTSVAGVIFYQAIAPFYPDMAVAPDWILGFLFGLGGMAGIYLGARYQKYMPAAKIKWILAAVILFTTIRYAADFFSY